MTTVDRSPYWSDIVSRLDPYVPGEQPRDQQYIKLNTNESPYPPAPGVARVLAEFDSDALRRYPDPESRALVDALAAYHGLAREQVFVGNGSDEVLAHAFHAFFQQTEPLLFPDISYSFYPVYCGLYRIDYVTVPLDDNFEIVFADYRRANGGIILPNPNAPTGIALAQSAIRELLADNPESVVIVDEAYVDFGAETSVPLIEEFANLLVVQTFSKSRNLAGLRLGCALGQAPLIEGLKRIKNSFNSYPVNQLTSAIGIAALADDAYFRDCRDRIVVSRARVGKALDQLGFEVLSSHANFVFARHRERDAGNINRALREAGILVRYFDKPRINGFLRISIGSEDECDTLLAALAQILA